MRRHSTGAVVAGAGCGGNAVTVDEETCSQFYCTDVQNDGIADADGVWVQCSTGTGPGGPGGCTGAGAFTANRVIKASASGTSCSFVNSAISEDGTTTCVLAEDLGLQDNKFLFWGASCVPATSKSAGIRFDTSSTPDEFDIDHDGTTRVNIRAITTGTNVSLNTSAQTLNLAENVSYNITQTAQTFRGFDVTGTMTIADPNLLANAGFEGWDCTGVPSGALSTQQIATSWSDRHIGGTNDTCGTPPAMIRSSTAFEGSYSLYLYGVGAGDGQIVESRAHSGGSYFSLSYATTYQMSFSYRSDPTGNGKAVNWTVFEYGAGGGSADNCAPGTGCFTLRNSATPTAGSPGTFQSDASNCNTILGNYPYIIMVGDNAWHTYTTSLTTRAGSGSFPAAISFCNGGTSVAGTDILIDAISLGSAGVDTGLTINLIAEDTFTFKPKTHNSGESISFEGLTGVLAKPKIAPETVAGSTSAIGNFYGVRAGLVYDSLDADGASTLTNAYSIYAEEPAFGTNKFAIYADGTCALADANQLWFMEASGDGTAKTTWEAQAQTADARYRWPSAKPTGASQVLSCTNGTPSDCSWITPSGTGASAAFTTIDTSSGTDPVADSTSDTLIIAAGSGITVTGDATTDTVTIAATGSGTVGGSGTLNAIPMFTPDGVTLGDSPVRVSYTGNGTLLFPNNAWSIGNYSTPLDTLHTAKVYSGIFGLAIQTSDFGSTAIDRITLTGSDTDSIVEFKNVAWIGLRSSFAATALPLRFYEPSGSGSSYVVFSSGAQAANRSCVFQDSAAPIPDSCVGDGVDGGGGIAGLTADSGGATTGSTVSLLGGTNGIDTVRSIDTITFNFDPTETFSVPIPVANGGTNLATATDDNVMVGNGTTWQTKAIPDSDGATQKLQYDVTTNVFSAGTDDDVPEAGDFGALVLTGDVSSSGLTTTIGADKVLESMLKSVNAPTDEFCLTSETTTGDFEWQSCSTGTVGGSGTANRVAKFTAATTLGNSLIWDDGTNVNVGQTGSTTGKLAVIGAIATENPGAAFVIQPGGAVTYSLNANGGLGGVSRAESVPILAATINGAVLTTTAAGQQAWGTPLVASGVAAGGTAWTFNSTNTMTGNVFDFQNAATSRFKQTGIGEITSAHAPTVAGGTSHSITQALPTGNYTSSAVTGINVQPTTASTGPAGACVGGSNPGTACSAQATCTGGGVCKNNANSGAYVGLSFPTSGIKGIWDSLYPLNVNMVLTSAPYVADAFAANLVVSLDDPNVSDHIGGIQIAFADSAEASITTNLIAGLNITAGGAYYGLTTASTPVVGLRMDTQTFTGATNVKGFALAHDGTFLNGKKLAWTPTLDTIPASDTVSWLGNTNGTSATLLANGAVILDSCANTASASSIAVNSCNKVTLTGSTTVNTITACDATNSGRVLYVLCGAFTGTICDEVVDGVSCGAAGNLRLTANIVCTADDTLTLFCDSSNWLEIGRGVN